MGTSIQFIIRGVIIQNSLWDTTRKIRSTELISRSLSVMWTFTVIALLVPERPVAKSFQNDLETGASGTKYELFFDRKCPFPCSGCFLCIEMGLSE